MNEKKTEPGREADPEGGDQSAFEAAIANYLQGNGGSVKDIALQHWLEERENTDLLRRGKITSIFYSMLKDGRIVRDHELDAYRLA